MLKECKERLRVWGSRNETRRRGSHRREPHQSKSTAWLLPKVECRLRGNVFVIEEHLRKLNIISSFPKTCFWILDFDGRSLAYPICATYYSCLKQFQVVKKLNYHLLWEFADNNEKVVLVKNNYRGLSMFLLIWRGW